MLQMFQNPRERTSSRGCPPPTTNTSDELNRRRWKTRWVVGRWGRAEPNLQNLLSPNIINYQSMYHQHEGCGWPTVRTSISSSTVPEQDGPQRTGYENPAEMPEPAGYAQILDEARRALDSFVGTLGEIKDVPLRLAAYETDFESAELEESLDLPGLYRLVESTIRKMKLNRKIKCNWSREDLLILLWVVQKYRLFAGKNTQDFDDRDWESVGSMIPGKTGQQTMFKWLSLKSNKSIEKKAWEDWEDRFLRQSVIEHDERQWLKISQQLFLQRENVGKVYRTAKQCRERWACYVNPMVKKGNWTRIEDSILIARYLEIGKRWSVITKSLQGRTENAVKNRWKLITNRRKLTPKRTEASLEQYLFNYLEMLRLAETPSYASTAIVSRQDLPQFQSQDKLEQILKCRPRLHEEIEQLEEKDFPQAPCPQPPPTCSIDSLIEQYIGNPQSTAALSPLQQLDFFL